MYIAMNRFKVKRGAEAEFEDIWRNRQRNLPEMDGFIEFKLLRGPENSEEGYTLFASHTIWASEESFAAWTRSQQFRDSHRGSGTGKLLVDGHPRFEAFSVVEGA